MNVTAAIGTTLDAVTDMMGARAGLIFPPSRRRDVEIATRKIMGAAALPNPREWLGCLEQNAALLDELISELTIKETYFFASPVTSPLSAMRLLANCSNSVARSTFFACGARAAQAVKKPTL
ncbi:hypothetical protein [Reyranella sp.]|uniref:hypothetical protein n=1 Tax=Reyranella sp. TaxID=1929291 RepID=UPI002731BF21|nr:hypothetical protein [Reyranella sp.]MDP2372797.1 hypothetical protein [Reyranella sp.]